MTFFDDLAQFYDLDHADVADDVEMYRSFALQTGAPVLELGCGTGRIALPLAHDGYEVAAVDFSTAMLDVLRDKLVKEPPDVAARVQPIQADMRRLELHRQFALALCPLNTFMHMTTRSDQQAMLARTHHHLAPGGTMVIDVVSAYPMLLSPSGEALTLQREIRNHVTGRVVQKFITMRFDHARQIQHIVLIYDEIGEDGTVKRATLPVDLRYVFRFEMELLLEKTGFSVDGVYGTTDLDPYGMDSERMIFVARR
jgi:ubiquinone/menaquinone biosynthesis C-methylase UbiE